MLKIIASERPPLLRGDIEKPDLRGGRTVVTRTAPMKPVTPIDHRFAVRGVIGIAERRIIFSQNFRAQRFHVQRIESVVRRISLAGKKKLFSVRAPAKRNLGAGMPGQLPRLSPVGRDRENVPVAVALAGKSNPASVRRKERVGIRLNVLGERRGAAAFVGSDPNVAPENKSQLLAVRTERGHSRADDRLERLEG